MTFTNERAFEDELIRTLSTRRWTLSFNRPTEEELIQNWMDILYQNNQGIDQLGDTPLTAEETRLIIDKISRLGSSYAANRFINGGTFTITRDCPGGHNHGRPVSLFLFGRNEKEGGRSIYQIARQPQFKTTLKNFGDSRGDITLLICGMPVIHIELKKSGIPVDNAAEQIERYSELGAFTGLFSLVQVFVAMTPEESVYFANPGPTGRFRKDFRFHWADYRNKPINDWKAFTLAFLSIPEAHDLISYFTVADAEGELLKVMRSYQRYAANDIYQAVHKHNREHAWGKGNQRGGYIWHTTGSGKTMTSFKAAQLVEASSYADKVVFVVDRCELSYQSAKTYRNLADEDQKVQGTESTADLREKLKSKKAEDRLIVTSIQKLSRIKKEDSSARAVVRAMQSRRLVFIMDECHRSTFGDMLQTVKETFPRALIFGFTGTPIMTENKKKDSTTADVFGNPLHSYTLADGIRDKNVLGFDLQPVATFAYEKMREAVALAEAGAASFDEVMADPAKKAVYDEVVALDYAAIDGKLSRAQFERPEHRKKVVEDIFERWPRLRQNHAFHALFAVSSIPEAILYYRLFKETNAKRAKEEKSTISVTALFDTGIDEGTGARLNVDKLKGLDEIISDYNEAYGTTFDSQTFGAMKKDIAARLKSKYSDDAKWLDILIVVDQMLTGYDAPRLNTLFLDKELKYASIIQAFSRTNRLYPEGKPFGIIRFYRRVHAMRKAIDKAVELYAGSEPEGLFVDKLYGNVVAMNGLFAEIENVFKSAGVTGFSELPGDEASRRKFASTFAEMGRRMEAAGIQGFEWGEYVKSESDGRKVKPAFTEDDWNKLLARYKELVRKKDGGDGTGFTYEVEPYLERLDTTRIDQEYLESRFGKYREAVNSGADAETVEKVKEDLHACFARLSNDDQRIAMLILNSIENGSIALETGKSFLDYMNEFRVTERDRRIRAFAESHGLDPGKFRELMDLSLDGKDLRQHPLFKEFQTNFDKAKAADAYRAEKGRNGSKVTVRAWLGNEIVRFNAVENGKQQSGAR